MSRNSVQEGARLDRRVVRLQPRVQPFERALEEYWHGRIGLCLDFLHGNSSPAARTLSARALMRAGQPDAALARLERPGHELSHLQIAESQLLRGAILNRLSRPDEALESFGAARVHAFASACIAVEAELEFYTALRLFAIGELDACETSAYHILSLEPYSFDNGSAYLNSINDIRARAFDLLASLEARRGRYLEQSAFACRAIGELALAEKRDIWFQCGLLANLSFVVRDLDLQPEAKILREHLSYEWPVEAVGFRFDVLRSLGMLAALRGDHVGALRDLRSAAEFAPSPTFRLAATLDRALLARELHQSIMAREELDYAERLSSQIDWANAHGEDRSVLLQLAEVLADRSAPKARRALDRYRGIKTKLAPTLLGTSDSRWRATEAFTEGVVLRAEGQNDRASIYLGEAFRIWDGIGFHWRAARAALELAEMTQDPGFVAYVKREAGPRPNSWLAYRTAQLVAD